MVVCICVEIHKHKETTKEFQGFEVSEIIVRILLEQWLMSAFLVHVLCLSAFWSTYGSVLALASSILVLVWFVDANMCKFLFSSGTENR